MKRWALWLALFLSLGFNLGLLASRWTDGRTSDDAARAGEAAKSRATPPSAADATPRIPPGLERTVVRVADELGLEGADRERFFDLQREFFGRTYRARRDARRIQQRLRRLLVSGRAERPEVDALMEQLTTAQGDAERAFFDHYFAMRALLDQEQMRRYARFLGQLRRLSETAQRS